MTRHFDYAVLRYCMSSFVLAGIMMDWHCGTKTCRTHSKKRPQSVASGGDQQMGTRGQKWRPRCYQLLLFSFSPVNIKASVTSYSASHFHQGSPFMSSRFLTSLCVTSIYFFQQVPFEANTAFVHFLEPAKASVNTFWVKNSWLLAPRLLFLHCSSIIKAKVVMYI